MGRIKTRFVKANATKIYEKGKDEFTEDFGKNKEIVKKHAQIPSKRLRNTIVGYVTRLKKQSEGEE